MKTRLTRRIGGLFAFSILAGCAVPPGQSDQVGSAPLSTKAAHSTTATAPLAYGAASDLPASAANEKGKFADADALTDDGPNVANFHQTGRASWYGKLFHGRRTANGERFNMNALTAAHRTLPLGSYVRVTNPATNDSVVVRINDRGPYARGRVIDLSYAAARVLHLQHAGTARVQIAGLTPREAKAEQAEMLAANGESGDEK
ncbi:septal ring lytic transglycosylase RlpA family protein [Paraburkholderia rhizosphaerae]|uniref:Endolytic peptidoglycan transglycosylase RlpA n=1 Tax=Paraburkholderia rhizosphaerae TaxID=480658 RepID=A0A4R8LQY3_9BURK|nr:septal ring lytic transglycosylase RlpA family protein [Paraburkholderia rhizosphaerae]TDY49894.1 rare lipoprotein A [Paraburkholderia rhizosphaerae]